MTVASIVVSGLAIIVSLISAHYSRAARKAMAEVARLRSQAAARGSRIP